MGIVDVKRVLDQQICHIAVYIINILDSRAYENNTILIAKTFSCVSI